MNSSCSATPACRSHGDDRRRRALARLLRKHLLSQRCPASARDWPADATPRAPPRAATEESIALVEQVRALRQYAGAIAHACRSRTTPAGQFLAGDPGASCTDKDSLAWFAPLAAPLHAKDQPSERVRDMLALFRRQGGQGADDLHAAFALALQLPHPDEDLMRFCMSAPASPASASDPHEYDAQVCGQCLSLARADQQGSGGQEGACDWPEFARAVRSWRDRGLTHVLWLAAQNMPSLDHWLPPDMQRGACARGFAAVLAVLSQPIRSRASLVEALDAMSALPSTEPASILIASTLDRLAVLMRVKSNCHPSSDLAHCLALFPHFDKSDDSVDTWHKLKRGLEQAMPPSLLCCPSDRRATW